jgi:hypothetical protein
VAGRRAVSTVSCGSHGAKATKAKAQGGVVLAALLGGAYSSTITTVAVAPRADEQRAHLFAGGILMASGVMYLRLAALVRLFSRDLFEYVGIPFLVLSVVAVALGWIWTRVPDPTSGPIPREFEPKNPLELGAALVFAGIFILTLIATQLAVSHLGSAGVYGLAAVMGLADVDPFIMGMTQAAGSTTAVTVAATAIVIAAAAMNNLARLLRVFLCRSHYRPAGVDRARGARTRWLGASLDGALRPLHISATFFRSAGPHDRITSARRCLRAKGRTGMRRTSVIALFGWLALTIVIGAQTKPPATFADYGQWEAIAPAAGRGGLSPDGRFLAYAINRSNRNNELRVTTIADGTTKVAPFGAQAVYSSDSKWLAYSIGQSEAEQENSANEQRATTSAC